MPEILYKIIPLFLVILLGAVFGFFNKSFSKSTVSELNRFAYFIGFPCIILNSLTSINFIPVQEIKIALINITILLIFTFITFLLTRIFLKEKRIQNTYFICTFFGNIAYLGFPLVNSINPSYSTGLSLHIAGYLIILFTIGIVKLEASKTNNKLQYFNLLKTIFFNPLLFSTLLGLLITIFNFKIPLLAKQVINMISLSASPIVLFALGIFIIQNKILKTSLFHISIISFIKLIILPLFFWISSIFLFKDYDLTISILLASMPIAITPFVLAEIYDIDKKVIAGAIIVSTVLGVVTIPIILSFT